MNFTEEQLQAIMKEGRNIIVSAGAGSGKTAVLSERVLRKVKDGIHVDELLILTFTNAAAKEMKERIRGKLLEAHFDEEVIRLEKAYITTFDAFALATVKKYHEVFNISREISICDTVFLDLKTEHILNELFLELYEKNDENFEMFISKFCTKDDTAVQKNILDLYHKLEMRYDMKEYLENYIENYYNTSYIEGKCQEYVSLLKEKQKRAEKLLTELSLSLDSLEFSKYESVSKFLHSTNYDSMVSNFTTSLPRVNKNYTEEAKEIKSQLAEILQSFKNYFIYENEEEIKNEILSTKPILIQLISILQELERRVSSYKKKEELYTFTDIFKLAIALVENHPDVRRAISLSFHEIMIDEYQDNNDLQEIFINIISHHNVYMVGDIKQSIYRFRNANPNIFKTKYDLYSNGKEGYKIDLNRNFRSRSEVLDDINLLFNDLMDLDIGGADYQASHQMIFGNQLYETKGKSNENYHLEVLKYEKSQQKNISLEEQEIFIICHDIKEKIQQGFLVFDKHEKKLRPLRYSDIVILLDKTKYFDLYKKIFEYFQIPLSVYKDEKLKNDTDIFLINHILKLIYKVKEKNFDSSFQYSFLAIARSYLFRLEDALIFSYFVNRDFENSVIIQKIISLLAFVDQESPLSFYHRILDTFEIEKKIITTQNIKAARIRLEYFYNMLKDFTSKGYTVYEFSEYLDALYDGEYDLSFSLNKEEENSCKIMTIHKSKGLEYPVCYFASFTSKFNLRELNEKFLYDSDYQIVTPSILDTMKPTIMAHLLKAKVLKEEIGEKIRLFYVALTRSKEKLIIVMPEQEAVLKEKESYRSFYDMMQTVSEKIEPFVKRTSISVSKEYLKMKDIVKHEFASGDPLEVEEICYEERKIEQKRYSKDTLQLITKEQQELLDLGVKLHELLEFMDFKKPNYEGLSSSIVQKLQAFCNLNLIQENLNSKFYHEYEFVVQNDGEFCHGVIDLLIENQQELIIVDYKLKNISDFKYQEQLEGYKKALNARSSKKVSCYLYSILEEKLEFIC